MKLSEAIEKYGAPVGFSPVGARPPTEKQPERSFLRRLGGATWKGLGYGFGVIGWPFQRAEYLMAGAAEPWAKHYGRGLGREMEYLYGRISPYEEPPPRISEAQDIAEIKEAAATTAQNIRPALRSLITWKPPEGVKTFQDVMAAWGRGVSPKEPQIIPRKITETAGGIGASFLATPWAVGKATKGLGALGRATPIYKAWARRQPPGWRLAKLIHRAESGARVEKAYQLAKAEQTKKLKPIAAELSKRLGKKITAEAVAHRLDQIGSGGITAERTPGLFNLRRAARTIAERTGKSYRQSLSIAQKYAAPKELGATGKLVDIKNPVIAEYMRLHKGLAAHRLLGEKTYITKLTRKEIAALEKTKSQLQSELGKLSRPPYQKELSRLASQLKAKGNDVVANQILRLAEQVERGDLRYIESLARLLDVNQAQLSKLRVAGAEPVLRELLGIAAKMNRQNPNLVENLGRILEVPTSRPGQLAQLVNKFETGREAERTQILKLLSRAGQKLMALDVKGIDESSLGPYAERILRLREREGARLINELLNIGAKAETVQVAGVKPLLRKIASMKRIFPGKAGQAAKIQSKIDDIDAAIRTSYHYGGRPYSPRMYQSIEEQRLARHWPMYSAKRIRRQYAKKRQDIPPEVRKAMGEISKPYYKDVRRMIQEGTDIETAKLYEQVARNPAWSSVTAQAGWKQMPEGKAYGAIAKRWVPKKIHDDITYMVRDRSNFEQLYDTTIGTWKLFKVVLNPATHFRNKIWNKIALDLSGMGFGSQARYAARFWKEYHNNTTEWQNMVRYLSRTGQVRGELIDELLRQSRSGTAGGLQGLLDIAKTGAKKITSPASRMYQHEEFINKGMKYLQMRDRGASVMQAVQEANKWLFDYGDIAVWEKHIARRVMPFYTFPRKALPIIAEAMAKNPYAVAKYPLALWSMQQYAMSKLNLTDKDYEKIAKTLPGYMQKGAFLLLPYRDDNGDINFFDWTYIFAWGILGEALDRGLLGVLSTNPFVQFVNDIMRNKAAWSQRQIWNESDSFTEQTFAKMKHFWQIAMPSLTPGAPPRYLHKVPWPVRGFAAGGIYWDKLYRAMRGETKRVGIRAKKQPLPEAIAHTMFGLRTQPIDIAQQRRWFISGERQKIKELRTKLRTLGLSYRLGVISVDEYRSKQQQYREQIRQLQISLRGKP